MLGSLGYKNLGGSSSFSSFDSIIDSYFLTGSLIIYENFLKRI